MFLVSYHILDFLLKKHLGGWQPEEGRHAFWNPEEGKRDLISLICSGIASEPFSS
jgi:hypothetical protein